MSGVSVYDREMASKERDVRHNSGRGGPDPQRQGGRGGALLASIKKMKGR